MSTQPPKELLTYPDRCDCSDLIAVSVDFNERNAWDTHARRFKCYASCWCCGKLLNDYPGVLTCLRGVVVCQRCEHRFKRKTASTAAKNFSRRRA